jgi:transcriptional regulator with XRE-family HTH domain
MDYERIASEFVRVLRGNRSQTAFSRRLGSHANVVYTWESGRRFPTAAKALWAAERVGVDVRAAVSRFYRTPPDWVASADFTSRDDVARLLDNLRGRTPLGDVAKRAGKSRFAVSRWLRGEAEPRLPDFLRLVEATSLRGLDFIAALADPSKMPGVAKAWAELEQARRAAYEMPWSQAVLRVLEIEHAPNRTAKDVSRSLGISEEEAAPCLDMLESTGQIRKSGERFVVANVRAVDTRQNPEAGKKLKAFWSRGARETLERGAASPHPEDEGLYSYNLFTVSEADYARLRELHLAYFRELRSIVAQSEPAERVVLANVQLLPLGAAVRAAKAPASAQPAQPQRMKRRP